MRISYDPKSDSMYLSFNPKAKSTKTVEIGEDIMVDYSKGKIIGVEILNASKKISTTKKPSLTVDFPTI